MLERVEGRLCAGASTSSTPWAWAGGILAESLCWLSVRRRAQELIDLAQSLPARAGPGGYAGQYRWMLHRL